MFHCICWVWLSLIWFNYIWFEAGGYDDCVRLSLIGFDYIRNCTHTIFLVQLRLIWGWRVWWLCSIEFDWVRLHQKLHSHNFFGSITFDLRLEGMMIVFDWVWLGSITSEIALTQFFLVQLRLILRLEGMMIVFDWVRLHQKLHSHNFFGSITFVLRLEGMMIVFDWVWLGSITSEIALTQLIALTQFFWFNYMLIWGWRVWWLCSIEFDWVRLHQKLHSHNVFGSITFDLRLEGMMIVFGLSLIGFDYIRNCTHTIFLVQLHLIWGWRVWWLCSIEFDCVRLHQKLHSHNFFGSIAFDLRLEGMMIVFDWVWLGLTTSEIALTQFFWFNCIWFEAGGL